MHCSRGIGLWWDGPQNSDEEGAAEEEDTLLKILLVLRSSSHFYLQILTWRPDLPLNDKHLSKKKTLVLINHNIPRQDFVET